MMTPLLPVESASLPHRRRLAVAVLSLLLAGTGLLLATSAPANAATVTVTIDGITYTVDDDDPEAGATVIDYDPDQGPDVVIPARVTVDSDDYPVIAIGDEAFRHDNLESVTIPDSVTTIDDYAFYDNGLTSVTIPDSVTTIGPSAFGDNRLTSVTIPDQVTTIASLSFSRNNLASVTIPDSVTIIDEYAFAGNQLTSANLPSQLTTIGYNAFFNNHLVSMTIPDQVTEIGFGVFGMNENLTEIVFAGPVPTTMTRGSLGGLAGLVVSFQWVYGAPQTPGGYTTPTWYDYTTRAITQPVTVSFDTGGHGTAPPLQDLQQGDTVAEPADPVEAGWLFTGWYTDQALTAQYDFDALVADDLVLYAGWQDTSTTPTPTPTPTSSTDVPGVGGGDSGGGSGDAALGGAGLPGTGSSLSPAVLAGGLAAVLAGVVMTWVARGRRTRGAPDAS